MQIKLYALRHITEDCLVTVDVSANPSEAEFCNSTSVELSTSDSYPTWVTTDIKIAEYVANTSTEWYSSTHDCPEHKFVGKLEIIPLVRERF